MCDPTTAALGLMAAGTMVSAGGAIMSGQNAQRAANYNAAVNEANAQYQLALGKYKETQQRAQDKFRRSKMESLFLKSGVQIDATSSAALVLTEQKTQDEMTALMIRNNAQNESTANLNAARLSRMKGNAAATEGHVSAAGTLLNGGGGTAAMGIKLGAFS